MILCVCPNFQFSNANGTISPQEVTLNASSEVGLDTNFDNRLSPLGPPVDEPIACFTLNFTCVFENATDINFVILEKQSDPNNASVFEREFQLLLTTVETGERFIVNYANSDIRTTNVIGFAGQYRCMSNTMRVTPTAQVDVLCEYCIHGVCTYTHIRCMYSMYVCMYISMYVHKCKCNVRMYNMIAHIRTLYVYTIFLDYSPTSK